jgi:hypothetical protein
MLKRLTACAVLALLTTPALGEDKKSVDAAHAGDGAPAGRKQGAWGVIVEPAIVTPDKVKAWKNSGVSMLVMILDEERKPEVYDTAASAASAGRLRLFYWIEVARNPRMAGEHPRWMAALGIHDDWQKRFPNSPRPGEGQVAKAFPWVPITYREAYDAHLARIKGLLAGRAAAPYAGVLLNDLQAGPASCGCGNLQCRWATDYHVASTATKQNGDDVAARFTAEVRKLAAGKSVVPVWTTECEDIDLPANLAPSGKSTHLCGSVPCADTTCPKAFTKQWMALLKDYDGPVGVLALEKELERDPAHAQVTSWVPRAVDYLDRIPSKHGGTSIPHERLWLVIQGYGLAAGERSAARKAAAECGAGAVLEALAPLPQSYEPRLIDAAPKR